MLRTLVLSLALALALPACGDGGKKVTRNCDTDADCEGGVCFSQQCYTACTSRQDCAAEELCVWKDDGAREVALCVVAADQAGCTGDNDCQGLLRLATCEQAVCAPSGWCDVAATAGCAVVGGCGDGTCGAGEDCSGCAVDCPCEGACVAGLCETGGGGDITRCNARDGNVQVMDADETAGLPLDAGSLTDVGVLGVVGDDGVATLYVWLKSDPEPIEDEGGHAVVLSARLPAGSTGQGVAIPEGQAIVNGRGTVGVDAEWLQIDPERSKVSWFGASVEAGVSLTATVDLWLTTRCGAALHEAHVAAYVSVTLMSAAEVADSRGGCLQILASALAAPRLRMGQLKLTVNGEPYLFDNPTGASAILDVEDGTLNLEATSSGPLVVMVDDDDPVLGPHGAIVRVQTTSAECFWRTMGAVTLAAPSGDLAVGPVSGTFSGTAPLLEGSDGACAPPSHEISGSFTAALCWYR